MQPDRARLLSDLLREMREEDGGFFPDEAWFEIHKNFALPYVEVVLVRGHQTGAPSVFLMRRAAGDPHWPGRPWHIPGGLWRVSWTLEQACAQVAKRETGVDLTSCREVMTFKWPDHAYANPISHVCVCETASDIPETEDARVFSLEHLPEPMLIHHGRFLAAARALLTGGEPVLIEESR
jgi:ADP-ribose pyrophosphatase YjhB (NUDIX family)